MILQNYSLGIDYLKALKYEESKFPIINDIISTQSQENFKHFELMTRREKCKIVRFISVQEVLII